MKTIDREELRHIMDDDKVTVVEVLDRKYFNKFHLPHAINVPLSDSFDEDIQRAVPDKDAPVAVYCQDKDCDASPKAAQRMTELGYEHVFDYEAGKVDWKDAGLPVES